MLREINFDGIVGPTHNYSGLSLGNLAATGNAGRPSSPREAALQGVAKMRVALRLGLAQGILIPHARPDRDWLGALATTIGDCDPGLRADAMSASAMWAANAATVSPAPDTADGRCHLTVANLGTMPHRSHEWPGTLAQLRLAFADQRAFAMHPPIPAPFGDEGAANHMRLCAGHGSPGVEVFVHGEPGGRFPARQHAAASAAIARRHGLDPDRTILARQSAEAIDAGAFHNDVVAVANETVILAHERAFADPAALYDGLRRLVPDLKIVEVPDAAVPLATAVTSYLFNAQLVSLDEGGMALILPEEARRDERVWDWLLDLATIGGPIRRLVPVDLRESMANGGGPACLRLRVVADPATVDRRFIATEERLDLVEAAIAARWPERIEPGDLGDPSLHARCEDARRHLLTTLGFGDDEL